MKEILLVLKKDLSYIARMKDILVIWEERFVLHENGGKPALDFVKNRTGLCCPFY